jgi:hypothetical protein
MRRSAILGAWELVSYVTGDGRGRQVHPLGADATGLILYTDDGYMSAQLMRAGRPMFDHPDPSGGTSDQTRAAAEGYLAYSGPFDVDEATGELHHAVTVSLLPNWLGIRQIRKGHLAGDELTLSLTSLEGGAETSSTLVWRRAAARPAG